MKRLLVIADFHSGHKAGLRIEKKYKYWEVFKKDIEAIKPIDICLANGDLIDGKGERWGGTEQLTTDRSEQKDMAIEILEFIDAKDYVFTYGTPYHTGKEEDWEKEIARNFNKNIKAQQFFEINGLSFHAKHKINNSTIPHGRLTALARQKVWNLFWSEFNEVPRVNIFIRSHVHYFNYCGGEQWLAIITPALQGWGSKYGERECEGTIDWGFVCFDIKNKQEWNWKQYIYRKLNTVSTIKL